MTDWGPPHTVLLEEWLARRRVALKDRAPVAVRADSAQQTIWIPAQRQYSDVVVDEHNPAAVG